MRLDIQNVRSKMVKVEMVKRKMKTETKYLTLTEKKRYPVTKYDTIPPG
jgi:hypothetical protein